MKQIYFDNEDNQLHWIDGCESGPVVVGKDVAIKKMKADQAEEGLWHLYAHLADSTVTDPENPDYWTELVGDYNLQGEKGNTGEKGEQGDRGIGCCIIFNRTNYTEAQWSEYEIGYQEYATRTEDIWLKDTIKLNELFIVTGISTDGGKLHMLVYKASDTYPESGKEEYAKGENVFGLLVSHLVLNKGPKGDTGSVGPMGPQGIQGIQGIQGPAGSEYPIDDTGEPSSTTVWSSIKTQSELPKIKTRQLTNNQKIDLSNLDQIETVFVNISSLQSGHAFDKTLFENYSSTSAIIVNPTSVTIQPNSDRLFFSILNFQGSIIINYLGETISAAECLAKDTPILISLEGDTLMIQDLEVGDPIVMYNRTTGELELSEVDKVVTQSHNRHCLVTFDDDTTLEPSLDHAILTEAGWRAVEPKFSSYPFEVTKLIRGDKVITTTGTKKVVDLTPVINTEDMYNLGVKNGDCFIADDVVVYESIR